MKIKLVTLKILSALLALSLGIHLNAQELSITQNNPDSMTVCMGDYSFEVLVTNQNPFKTAENIKLSVKFPVGISYSPGTLLDALENDISNLNQVVFSLGALNPGDSVLISYAASASCELIPSIVNDHAVTNLSQLTYDIAGIPQIPVSAPLISYTILYANLNVSIENPLSQSNNMLGTRFGHDLSEQRNILIENEGTGSTDTITIRITPEAEIRYSGFYAGSGGFPIPFYLDGNDYILTLAGPALQAAVLEPLTNNMLLEPGEKARITEDFELVNCASLDTTGTKYLVSWGCNHQSCNFEDNNAEASANMGVSPYEPDLVLNRATYPATDIANYCGEDGFLEFLFINQGQAPGGWAKNLDLMLSYGPEKMVSLSDFSINGMEISDGLHGIRIHDTIVTDRCDPSAVFLPSIHFDFSQALMPVGAFKNIGDDLFFDDLAPGDSILIRYRVHIKDSTEFFNLVADPTYRALNLGLPKAYYESQCGETYCIPSSNQPAYTSSISGGTTATYAPSDMVQDVPQHFRFCTTGWDTRTELLKCDRDSFYLKLLVPDAYQLAGSGNASWISAFSEDSISLNATQNGNVISLGGGGHDPLFPTEKAYWNGCYQLDLVLTCDPLHAASGTIDWEMDYVCDDCASVQKRASGSQVIFNHYSCGSGSCSGIETTSFELTRNSFGWTDFTQTEAVNAETQGIDLKAAYPGDHLLARLDGISYNGDFDRVFAEISYLGSRDLLTAVNGHFEVFDQAGVLQTSCAVNGDSVFNDGLNTFLRFEFPCSHPFQAGDSIVFVEELKVGNNNIPNDQYIPQLEARFFVVRNEQKITCTSWGESFTLYEPLTGFYEYYSNSTSCSVRTIKLMVKQDQAHYKEDFPNEFRSSFRLDDTITVVLPEGFEAVSNGASAYCYATASELNTNLVLDHIETLSPAQIHGDTLVFVHHWSGIDRVKQNVPVFSISIQPGCEAPDSGDFSLNYNWTYRDYAADESDKEPVYGKMEYMTNPVFDGFSHLAVTFQKPNLKTEIVGAQTQDGFERNVSYQLQLCNQNTTENPNPGPAENVWFDLDQLEGNSGKLIVDHLSEISTTSSLTEIPYLQNGDSSLFVQLGTVNANECRFFEVSVRYSNCSENEEDSLRVLTGWNCSSYPNADQAELASCQLNANYLSLRYKTADLAWIIDLPDTTFNPGDAVPYEAFLTSSSPAFMYDVAFRVELPFGAQISGQQYMYPLNSGIWQNLAPASTTSAGSGWDLTAVVPELAANNHGIPGTQEIDLNKIRIRFNIVSSCGFDPFSAVNFAASGLTNCNDSIKLKFDNRLPITGFEVRDSLSIVINAPDSLSCSENETILLVVNNLSASATNPADSMEMVLPNGVFYLSGLNSPQLTATDNGSRLSWALDPIAPNSSSTFGIQVRAGESEACHTAEIQATAFLKANPTAGTAACTSTRILAQANPVQMLVCCSVPLTEFCIELSGQNKFCSGDSVFLAISDPFHQIEQIDWYLNGEMLSSGEMLYASRGGNYSAQIHQHGTITVACSTLVLHEIRFPEVTLPDTLYQCQEGQELLLDAGSGIYEYLWYQDAVARANGQTYSVTKTGLYTVKVSSGNTCFTSDSVLILSRGIRALLVSSEAEVCANQAFTLTTVCDPALTYSWERRPNDNATWAPLPGFHSGCSVDLNGLTALNSASTQFRVLIYDQLSGCSYDAETRVIRLAMPCNPKKTGINRIYPNPTLNHRITLDLDLDQENITEAQLEVYSLTGDLVRVYELNPRSQSTELDLNELALGSYFVRLIANKELRANERFIIAE